MDKFIVILSQYILRKSAKFQAQVEELIPKSEVICIIPVLSCVYNTVSPADGFSHLEEDNADAVVDLFTDTIPPSTQSQVHPRHGHCVDGCHYTCKVDITTITTTTTYVGRTNWLQDAV